MEPFELGLSEAAACLDEKSLAPSELMRSMLDRIRHLEPHLKVWATLLEEKALHAADIADSRQMNDGRLSFIDGVGFGAKDIFDTAGIRTAAGSKIWADRIPDDDAASIRFAADAGGLLVGKTHTTEFADGDPAPCRNPWGFEHTPGGSSTGSAVAVAARMVPWAFGSQTVGSVLRPAAYNGIVGLKPTFGRISRVGVVPMASSFDHVGVLARSVEDIALLLNVFAGHDPADSHSADYPVADYTSGLLRSKAPRVGLVRGWFFTEADAETRLAIEETAQQMVRAGADLIEIEMGIDFDRAYSSHRLMQESEMAVFHEPMYRGNEALYGPKISVYIENGFRHSAQNYVEASGYRLECRRLATAALQNVDALLIPTASSPAPRDLTQTGDTRFQSLCSFTGLPSISIPIGLSGTGLPIGAQFVAPAFEESRLISVANWVEQMLGLSLDPWPASRMDQP